MIEFFLSAALLRETTPAGNDPALEAFALRLTGSLPVRVPVAPAKGAQSGWCYRNVAKEVEAHGGRPVFGRTIWCCSLFATAEFHAVHRESGGALVDVTPKPDGERAILFASDLSIAADFDFMTRPANERLRLYHGPSAERRAVDLIAGFTPSQEKFERGRAASRGLDLVSWITSRMKPDQLEVAIDRFLDASKDSEALLVPTPQGQWCNDIPRYRATERRRQDLFKRLLRTWEAHPARLLGSSAPNDGGPTP